MTGQPDRIRIINEDIVEQGIDQRSGELSMFTCPDCGGTLWQVGKGPSLWFQCHVGHGYAPDALLNEKSEELEGALWASIRLLRERAALTRQVATRLRESGQDGRGAVAIDDQAQIDERRADVIHEILDSPPSMASHIATDISVEQSADRTAS